MHFKNRTEAGQKLAEALAKYKGADVVIYALPRGGVVVGYEIARKLGAPLDIVVTRKIGHPANPEYAICAVAEDGHMVCNESEAAMMDKKWLEEEVLRERQEARRRREAYLEGLSPISPGGKTAILVDDGIATGLTMFLAIREARHQKPKKVVVAVPVAPPDSAHKLREEADELVALDIPDFYLGAVGAYYDEFSQVSDEEVIRLLQDRRHP